MLDSAMQFLCEADRLKSVTRANVLMDLSRPENSAEHSWHVALQAMVMGASDRAIAMILIHDLVEIDVGDQPIHLGHDSAALQKAEAQAARRIFGLAPQARTLIALWQEFEEGRSPDAAMAKRMDHTQPVLQVLMSPDPLPNHMGIVRDNLTTGRASRLAGEWPAFMEVATGLMDGGTLPDDDLGRRMRFLAEADQLKSVIRASLLIDNSRRENSAEHSWHLALYALILARQAPAGVDAGRVIRMLLIHDLVEIDVGDVPLHSAGGQAHGAAGIKAAEAEAARRIFGILPERQGQELLDLWTEFEDAATPDAIFAKALDRCQPAVQNIMGGGIGWAEYGVTRQHVTDRVGRQVERGAPALWSWLDGRLGAFFA
ncbi:HD domain-containing protein [Paracoccus sp. 1_MG-2023]|uniref:HD domain-containing protein n=1 Tax=unclassified Paracoccus (in: a-proteobacteria) TaxID=2688777 RepID=UPI001C0A2402|nr:MULTISPECIES: HD domain-containing protein [unclassified Paracoccus (in: a-proteobacteria)]MBU2957491.1 HD domain-containing protein [Paracoccus sp. C2R09]MDO6670165.1 HD domain-containing protein [Paracoccus sp. 1_MG-2023]